MPTLAGMDTAQWCRWYDAMEPLAATRFLPHAAPARLLFLWGRQDWSVPPRLARAMWAAAPAGREAIWYESGHMLPEASGDDQRRWLAARLGTIAPPTFRGPARDFVGTYAGWGGQMDPVEVHVAADSAGRLRFLGPFTGPDDHDGRLTYLGRTSDGERFRYWDKQLTFVRAGGRVAELWLDAPLDAPPDVPRVHLVLRAMR